ncbi:MAG: TIM-barrel domain-containing protein, partial [Myxococcota bacterium]|nr:TIM-barrel domain-containing protein [Myxococcota bacterium]
MLKSTIQSWGGACLLFFLVAACGNEQTEDDMRDTLPFPAWSFEHWVWEDESTQESAEALVAGYLERDIPVGAIIIDSPWSTGYSTFEFDTDLFPDAQAMIDGFHAQDVKVMLW